jgi:two-component system, LytTR family, sensor kinase
VGPLLEVTGGTTPVTAGIDAAPAWRFNRVMVDHAAPVADVLPEPHYLRRPLWLLTYFGLWVLLGIWLGSNSVVSHLHDAHPPPDWHVYVWELSSAPWVGALALAIAWFERRVPITGPGLWRRLRWHLPAAFAFSLAHVLGMVALRKLAYAVAGQHYDFGNPLSSFAYEFQKDVITYAAIVAIAALLRVVPERRRQQLREMQLRQAATDARLAHLSAQIEPHFIFNTLNAISNRMYEDVTAADRMLVSLADLLRAAMAREGAERVPVAEEMRWLQAYCHLMSERQPGLLEVEIDVDAPARDALIPRLLLQPLVENAFRHGLRSGRGRLSVHLRARGEHLRATVRDDGDGPPARLEPGLGLANVRERLVLMYPDNHRLELRAGDGGGTEAILEIPLERADDAATGDR